MKSKRNTIIGSIPIDQIFSLIIALVLPLFFLLRYIQGSKHLGGSAFTSSLKDIGFDISMISGITVLILGALLTYTFVLYCINRIVRQLILKRFFNYPVTQKRAFEIISGLSISPNLKATLKLELLSNSRLEDIFGNYKAKGIDQIFISHSHEDSGIARSIVVLLEQLGVPSNQIYCSSLEEVGTRVGRDFKKEIYEKLNAPSIVFSLLSNNYYKSPDCMCEMGAAWIKSAIQIPVVFPDLSSQEIKGLFNGQLIMELINPLHWNQVRENIEYSFHILFSNFNGSHVAIKC